VNVVVETNVSQAIVKSGVRINQDLDWRDDRLNPHPNQDNSRRSTVGGLVFDRITDAPDTITRSSGSWIADGFSAGQKIVISGTNNNNGQRTILGISSDGKQLTFDGDVLIDETSAATLEFHDDDAAAGEQTFSVEATNYAQLINMTGIFSLPSLDIDAVKTGQQSASGIGAKWSARMQKSGPRPVRWAGRQQAAAWAGRSSSTPAPTPRTPSWKMAPKSTAAPTAVST
jgi:hypothetical protein